MPGISDLLDSDTETNFVDENSLISSVSEDTLQSVAQGKSTAPKKAPKKRKCVTMPKKPRAKTATTTEPTHTSKSTGTKRKVAEIEVKDDVDENDLVEFEVSKTKARKKKVVDQTESTRTAPKATKARTNKKTAAREEPEEETEDPIPSPVNIRSNFAQTKNSRAVPRPVAASKVAPNSRRPVKGPSRPADEVISEAEEDEQDDIIEQQPARKRMRTESRVRQEPSYRRRAGSVSDTERGDPMLRRKLGDMTRKYENIDIKYRNLKDVAISEANANVEKLRQQCQAVTEKSDKLIESLKKQLAQQAPLAQESKKLRKDVENHETQAKKLTAQNKDLSAELATAQNEIKSLQVKLAAARAAPVPEVKQSTKTVVAARNQMPVSSQSKEIAQLKLDLYTDLTGLIIHSVKQEPEGDTFDCLQTGRNGTLHFKLHVDAENAKKSGFDEMEYLYSPQLNENRDADLIRIMPDYLTEDITFVRDVAPKFYARVVKTMTEKPAEDEGE